jgi:hypothetical protein
MAPLEGIHSVSINNAIFPPLILSIILMAFYQMMDGAF